MPLVNLWQSRLQQMVVRDEPYLLRKKTKKRFNIWSSQLRDHDRSAADRIQLMRRGSIIVALVALLMLLVSFTMPTLDTSEIRPSAGDKPT
jgi:hypothetical protein